MAIGYLLILVGAIIISFCVVTMYGVINGKIDGIVLPQEKIGISAFLLICFFTDYALLHGGIKFINM